MNYNLLNNKIHEQSIKLLGAEAEIIEPIRYKDGIYVCRTTAGGKHCVFKYFENKLYACEIQIYALLKKHGMQTLNLYGTSADCICMEDLKYSPTNRLAEAEDVNSTNRIKALAKWYKKLHGIVLDAKLLNSLYNENSIITVDNIEKLIEKFPDNDFFNLFIKNFKIITEKLNALPKCLCYNDFAYENMICSKTSNDAFMYDFNLAGVNYPYADIRNVLSGLNAKMQKIFLKEYSNFDKSQIIPDKILGSLVTIINAYIKYNEPPKWAAACIAELTNGTLFKNLKILLKNKY